MRVGLRVSALSHAHALITRAQTLMLAYARTRASTRSSLSPSVLARSASLATYTFIAEKEKTGKPQFQVHNVHILML